MAKSKTVSYYLNNGNTQIKYFQIMNNLETLEINSFEAANQIIKLAEEMPLVSFADKNHFINCVNNSKSNIGFLTSTLAAFQSGIGMRK